MRRFSPGDVVLKSQSESYTKLDIQKEMDRYISTFSQKNIKNGDRIILLLENGFNAICSQFACSVIGAVFIPVNPNEPKGRLLSIIEKYRPKLILVNNEIPINEFPESVSIINLNKENEIYYDPEIKSKLDTKLSVHETLYIISTSGTTGNPKGIMMSHKATISFFDALVNHCNLTENDVVGSISPLQFDFSLLDLGLAWGSQSILCVFSQSLAYTPKKLLKEIERNGITQMDCVPAIWIALLRYCKEEIGRLKMLKSILYAGDKFPLSNMEELWKILPELKIINCFGQSESIACTFFDLYADSNLAGNDIPIGNGYEGSIFYLVDETGNRISKDEIPGELWLSNDSLFDGYWENPQLNEEKLIKDPFSHFNSRRVYKTGDILIRKGSNYLFLGRRDNQVKVNGNRVELDEIEQIVSRMNGISEVAAIGKQHENTIVVSLYVSLSNGKSISEDEIRRHCRINLPMYMVPNEIFISNSSFPVTVNGKVDKKKLSEIFIESKI